MRRIVRWEDRKRTDSNSFPAFLISL